MFVCRGNTDNGLAFQVVLSKNSDHIVFNCADPKFGGECKRMDGGFVKGSRVEVDRMVLKTPVPVDVLISDDIVNTGMTTTSAYGND